MWLMRSAMLLAFVALYGCATAPGYRSAAIAIPASYRGMTDGDPAALAAPAAPAAYVALADSTDVPADYWDQLGDTTLTRLVGEVLRGNLDVRSARARVSAARSDRIRSVLDLTPSATLA